MVHIPYRVPRQPSTVFPGSPPEPRRYPARSPSGTPLVPLALFFISSRMPALLPALPKAATGLSKSSVQALPASFYFISQESVSITAKSSYTESTKELSYFLL